MTIILALVLSAPIVVVRSSTSQGLVLSLCPVKAVDAGDHVISPKDMRPIPQAGKKTAVDIRTAQHGPSILHGDRMTDARAAAKYVAAALSSTSSLASYCLECLEAGGCGGSISNAGVL